MHAIDHREDVPIGMDVSGRRLGDALAHILIVADSDQHRETLAILLEREFWLSAVREVEETRPVENIPAAVVLSPTRWNADVAACARERWPAAALVLVDAPAVIAKSVPGAIVASWSDPLSLRRAIVQVANTNLRNELVDACAELGYLLNREIGLQLKVSKLLTDLAVRVPLPHSTPIARKMFGEQLAVLRERLFWVDFALPDFPGAIETVDLGGMLSAVVGEYATRLFCRGIEIEWDRRGCVRLDVSRGLAELLVRCLATVLLTLRSSRVRVRVEESCVALEHPALGPGFRSLPLVVVERLLRGGTALRLGREPGCVGLYLHHGGSE